MLEADYLRAALGGVLIGVASVTLLWLNGRIAGISGIVHGMFSRATADRGWRIAFVAGLVLGGLLFQWLSGQALMTRVDYPVSLTVGAGLLVGFGTRMGSGCTSGHGVCGVSRLSPRSIAATVTFVAIGMLTATLLTGMLR